MLGLNASVGAIEVDGRLGPFYSSVRVTSPPEDSGTFVLVPSTHSQEARKCLSLNDVAASDLHLATSQTILQANGYLADRATWNAYLCQE